VVRALEARREQTAETAYLRARLQRVAVAVVHSQIQIKTGEPAVLAVVPVSAQSAPDRSADVARIVADHSEAFRGDAATVADMDAMLGLVSLVRLPIGDHQQATALKLAMNLNIAAQMEALSEAITMARRAGISDDVFFGALARNASQSGLAKLKEPKLRASDFSPQFSVKHMLKDMRLAAGIGGCEAFPVLGTMRDRLAAADQAGLGDQDFSVLVTLLNKKSS
jgi:3-hydroxyisobutyrate dehydrogenase-like beta-hydroxyacid dehydrogenase